MLDSLSLRLAERLKDLRHERQWTLAQLADQSNVSRSTLSMSCLTVSAEPAMWSQATTRAGTSTEKRIQKVIGMRKWATSTTPAWNASASCDQPRKRVGLSTSRPSSA